METLHGWPMVGRFTVVSELDLVVECTCQQTLCTLAVAARRGWLGS
jgi:hypothetical protein